MTDAKRVSFKGKGIVKGKGIGELGKTEVTQLITLEGGKSSGYCPRSELHSYRPRFTGTQYLLESSD